MSKYVAFLDILGFKEKLKKLKQQDAKSFIGRFSTTAFEQWENMSPTLVEGYAYELLEVHVSWRTGRGRKMP